MPWLGHGEGVKEVPAAPSGIPFLRARQTTGNQWVNGLAVGWSTWALVSACPDITVRKGMGLPAEDEPCFSLIMKVGWFVLIPFLYNNLKEGCSKVGNNVLLLRNKWQVKRKCPRSFSRGGLHWIFGEKKIILGKGCLALEQTAQGSAGVINQSASLEV